MSVRCSDGRFMRPCCCSCVVKGCARHRDVDFNYSDDWSAYLTDAKDLPEPQLIDDDNEVSTEE